MHRIANGVWQLAGFPRDWINVYVVKDILIDAGTRWATRRILRQVRNRPIRLVALTHCHPDHQGAAKAVCQHFGVPLACHAADVPVMEGRAPLQPDNRLIRFGNRLWSGPPHQVGRILADGDELSGFRVIHTPGHTPGHVMFFRETDRVCIAGDVLANIHFLTARIALREPPWFFSVDPVENRRSIQTLAALRPKVVCFGHGPPLRRPELLDEFLARQAWSFGP
jgi:glyoxylase-like metal-dependent hydrolase (beta-lactamase superfamily II)